MDHRHFLVSALGALLLLTPARADEPLLVEDAAEALEPLDRWGERLAVAVAQLAANETGLRSEVPADLAMIYQVARRHAPTPRGQLFWLRQHSSCVLTDRPLRGREAHSNCPWTRNLTARATRPGNWRRGSWARVYRPRWEAYLAEARRLVAGAEPESGWPCAENPQTWDGRRWMASALRRGYRPVACVGTRNVGYHYPRNR